MIERVGHLGNINSALPHEPRPSWPLLFSLVAGRRPWSRHIEKQSQTGKDETVQSQENLNFSNAR